MNTGYFSRLIFLCTRLVAFVMVFSFIFIDVQYFFSLGPNIVVRKALAAESTITPTANTSAASHTIAGSAMVFVSDQVGYKFFRTGTGTVGACAYRKTTDGGVSWGGEVIFDSQADCLSPSVWYDRWTPGDTGNYIHISTVDPGADDVWYNRLDTTTDTLLMGSSPVSASVGSGQGGSFTAGANKQSMAKGTDGTIYIAISDNSDSFVVECTTNCGVAGSWTETGTNPMDLIANDFQLLVPLVGGSLMLINRDGSADSISSKKWNNSSWDASWTTIAVSVAESTAYDVGMAAVSNVINDEIYFAYIDLTTSNNFTTANHDIKMSLYNGTSWTTKPDIITNASGGLTNVSLGIDSNTNDVYAAYSMRTVIGTPTTANVYWASSTSALNSWGTTQGPVNTSSDDIYGVDINNVNNQRLYVSWYGASPDDIFGDTILDTSPATIVSSVGSQTSGVRASSTDFYLGGQFVIEEFSTSRTLTSVTISEVGTIDASTNLSNIKLAYDLDTSDPYDCASESYGGGEPLYGSIDTNGFNGPNGVSSFSGSVTISPTQSFCAYVVLDVAAAAVDGSTIDVEITDPTTDVVVTGGVTPTPPAVIGITGVTTVSSYPLTQAGYHFRNDDGSEVGATSATGGTQNTPITSLASGLPIRLRLSVNNDGSTTTLNTRLKLEYAPAAPTCEAASSWVGVNATEDDFQMYDSSSLTNAQNTTNISIASGGITDSDTNFLSPNGGVRDTEDLTGLLNIDTLDFIETEFSIVASTSATQGQTYCFRLTDNGTPLQTYTNYPSVTIAADVTVSSTGSHIASADIPSSNVYLGGAFVIDEGSGSRTVDSITITQTGTVDGTVDVANVKLFYDLDTTSPYNCASESYAGGELQYGATDVDGFSNAQGSSTFSGSVVINSTSTMCVYVVLDVTGAAQSNDTIAIKIDNPSSQVVVSSGTVSPSAPVAISGSTTVAGAVVTQTHYHWRNDDGTEAGATSATAGVEDTALLSLPRNNPVRLRMSLYNSGGTSSLPRTYKLQYGVKITTCDAVVGWTNVGATTNDSFDMYDSSNLTHGNDTTNILVADGGVTDGSGAFISSNAGVRDTSDTTGTLTFSTLAYTDFEFSITSTNATPYESDFCFRVLEDGQPLVSYLSYPELTTIAKRDFKVQRGSSIVSGTGLTLTAGVDYVAPASTSSAFVRITNSSQTGAGDIVAGGNQNADDVTAYISDSTNITSAFTIGRDTDSINETWVDWEIIEFIGVSGTDNEMVVRDVGTFNMGVGVTQSTSSVISSVNNGAKVVVYITGALGTAANRTSYADILITTDWSSSTKEAIFTRLASSAITRVSYAVVEYTGDNWNIQRVEHTFTATGAHETETITPVTSINKAFVYGQMRTIATTIMSDFSQLVYLPSIGSVTFFLEPLATNPGSHTSVAWVIENLQNGQGEMAVYRSSGQTSGGPEPSTISWPIGATLNDTSNASIFATAAVDQNTTNFPRPIAGFTITSTTTYQLWRSDTTGQPLDFRTEIIEWPAADVSLRQNYYRLYVDNGNLKPTDPWPAGATDLGENTAITALDSPIADGERVRIRMSVKVSNSTLVAGLQPLKIQYAARVSTCSAIDTWFDVGDIGSSGLWRGYDLAGITDGTALSINPPTGGDLLLSVSDRAGVIVEENESSPNPYSVLAGEDLEYDFVIENNGAVQRTTYCFRLVRSGDVAFAQYLNYPQIRTNGYSPVTENWQWFDDEASLTPVTAMAAESVAPTEVTKGNTVRLRVTVDEINNLGQNDTRFKLQFADNPSFTDPQFVEATTTCITASIWCYADGGGFDNATITTSVLSTSDICIAGSGPGCGTYNESPNAAYGFRHNAYTAQEYDFAIQYQPIANRFGQVWYFRLYDVTADLVVSTNTGYSYPSLVGQSGTVIFTVSGLPSGTSTEGVVTDASTTPTSVPFGDIAVSTAYVTGQRLSVTSDAAFGYTVYALMRDSFKTDVGATVDPIAGTNASPVSWSSVCSVSTSCIGYHAGDDTLDGVQARFSADDSFAAFTQTGDPVMYNAASSTESSDMIYKLQVNQTQAPGDYAADVVYIAVPTF